MKKNRWLLWFTVVNLLLSVSPLSLVWANEIPENSSSLVTESNEMPEDNEVEASKPLGETETTSSETATSLISPTSDSTTSSSTPEEGTDSTDSSVTEETESSSSDVETEEENEDPKPEGDIVPVEQYLTVTNKNYTLWKNFDWETNPSTGTILNKTFYAKDSYEHENGRRYFRLLEQDGKEVGLIEEGDVTLAPGPQGAPFASKDYVTITSKNYNIWSNFTWKYRNKSVNVYQKTFQARVYYNHQNGEKYLSLYDSNGTWHGYINANATKKAAGPQGIAQKSKDYVTITSKNYNLWSNFNWKYRSKSANIYQKTFQARVYYNHQSGAKYLSLYDSEGTWHGYINEKATKKAAGPQGIAQKSKDYVTVTSKTYNIWSNFNWKYRSKSASIYQKTFQARVYYNHQSGAKYLSLYDSKGTWHGYINEKATKKAAGPQGIWFKKNEEVLVNKRNYPIWNSFSWQKKTASKKYSNQRLYVKGYYNHQSGETYYSLYTSKGKWVGYINAKGVNVVPGAAQFMGTTRKQVVNRLKSHENDRYYLGTPYRSLLPNPNPNRLLSPRGASTGFGPGMNCTGFVAHGMRNGGGKLNTITNSANAWGGIANAYNWRDALKRNTKYEVFNSVSELLKSGKAKQGDILYFEPDFSQPGYDCHIGFFWGTTPKQNKIWHSVAIGNSMGKIGSGTPYTKIYLFPLD